MRSALEDLSEVEVILDTHLEVLLRLPGLNPENNPKTQRILNEASSALRKAAEGLTTPELTIFLFSMTTVWVKSLILMSKTTQSSNQN